MLDTAVRSAIVNRMFVVMALIGLIAAGMFMLPQLNLDAFPDVTNVQVSVNTEAPGLAAEEVEQLITYPVEAAMLALPDVEDVRSVSKTGLSLVTVVFKEGTDIYFARQLVFEKLQEAKENIPPQAGTPEIGPITEALDELGAADPRLAQVVQMRYFGGLSESEIAECLGVTERTVQRDWQKARLFLSLALR